MMGIILLSLLFGTVATIIHGLMVVSRVLNIQFYYIGLIHDHNQRCIDLELYDDARIDYDIRPKHSDLMWRLFFFRSYDDLIHPELKALEK